MCNCMDCKYRDAQPWDKPCATCRNSYDPDAAEYNNTPLLFVPREDTPEIVDHPSHYNAGEIECIDAMISAYGKEAVQVFCLLNAFKYLWRCEHKNGKQDLEKATWYIKKHLELEESTNE